MLIEQVHKPAPALTHLHQVHRCPEMLLELGIADIGRQALKELGRSPPFVVPRGDALEFGEDAWGHSRRGG